MKNSYHANSICPATGEYIKKGLLSAKKIKALGFLKEFIENITTKDYLDSKIIFQLEKKYGEKPSIQTWGDYFQSEIAEDHFDKNDKDFEKIIETVRFDLIAAALIFEKKKQTFFDFVHKNYELSMKKSKGKNLNSEEEEAFHLGILMSYYKNLGLSEKKITDKDYDWFYQFSLAKAN